MGIFIVMKSVRFSDVPFYRLLSTKTVLNRHMNSYRTSRPKFVRLALQRELHYLTAERAI